MIAGIAATGAVALVWLGIALDTLTARSPR